MRVAKLSADLLAFIGRFPPGDRRALLELVQQWVKARVPRWSVQLRGTWGLDRYAEMELSAYPVEESSLNPDEEFRRLDEVRPDSMDTLAMRIRDILWEGITVESSVECPRCHDTQLRVLVDPGPDAIVLSCDRCSWSQTAQGQEWKRDEHWLVPATRARLERWRRDDV